MPTVTIDCPHCMSDNMTFDVVGWRWHNVAHFGCKVISAATSCRKCQRIAELIFVTQRHSPSDVEQALSRNGDLTNLFSGAEVFPQRPAPEAPNYISPEVERAFLQAERARLRGDLDAAGGMYRKALDVGTKQKAPNIQGMLAARLRAMNQAGMLTPDIADWADQIRLLGNDAAHDPEEPTLEETDDLANLTRMALVYLFEMPERIRLMRERHDSA